MNKIYLFLAAILLLCLAPMPYGYYVLVRFLSMVGFGIMAYRYYQEKKESLAWTFGILALLFQPFAKIALGRLIWNIVDVIVAVGLIILFFIEKKKKEKESRQVIPLNPKESSESEKQENNRFEFQLEGKLAPKELIYVASEEDRILTELFEKSPEVFEGWGQMIGYHVIYLPLLLKRLKNAEVLQYRAPYLTNVEIASTNLKNDFLLQYLNNPSDKMHIKHGLIRTEDIHRGDDGKDKAINRFYPLTSNSSEPIADQLHRIGKQISIEQQQHDRLIESYDDWGDVVSGGADDGFNSQLAEENIDDLIEEVKERILKLRQRGISQYILEQLIHPDDRLSKMVITKDYRIILPDYNNMEIKMEPLVKAVYLLFLAHPEGILFKRLPDYREELTRLYVKLRPTGLTDRVLRSIEDVTNPVLNSINEKCARIRGVFVGQFDDHMARHYYIDGSRGEPKKISLPRDLVIWETD